MANLIAGEHSDELQPLLTRAFTAPNIGNPFDADIEDGRPATIGLCFGRAGRGASDEHISVGSTMPVWRNGSWLESHKWRLRNAELTAAGHQALKTVIASYDRCVAVQLASTLSANRRRAMLNVAFKLRKGKPLQLRRHIWHAFDGHTGQWKPRCIRCRGTTNVKCAVKEQTEDKYLATEYSACGCAETRVLCGCMDVDTSQRKRILQRVD